jgi:CBS domain-containing protein
MKAGGNFLLKLMWVNVVLVGFNMIPAFPMDGGRVLRALLATQLDYSAATGIAATVGQIIAILFGLLGLFFNPFLLFIALFVYLGAQQEAHSAAIRSAMRGVPVRDAMITTFRTLAPDDTLRQAVSEILPGGQRDFPVVEAGQVVGMLTRDDVLRAVSAGDADHRVADVMRSECLKVEDSEMLDRTFERMREHGCSSLAVVRHGSVVGLLTLENVGELMMIHSAMRRAQPRSRFSDILGG